MSVDANIVILLVTSWKVKTGLHSPYMGFINWGYYCCSVLLNRLHVIFTAANNSIKQYTHDGSSSNLWIKDSSCNCLLIQVYMLLYSRCHYQSTSDFPVCVGWPWYFPSVRLTGRESTGGGAFSLPLLVTHQSNPHPLKSTLCCSAFLGYNRTHDYPLSLFLSLWPLSLPMSFTKTYTLSNRSFLWDG